MTPAIDAIRAKGDMLERRMFADDNFAQSFSMYAEIWMGFVLPNRDPQNPGFAVDEWQAFGETHYSAIVRCWNMRQSLHRIQQLCEDFLHNDADKAGIILDLQRELLSFFGSAGAFKDNLEN